MLVPVHLLVPEPPGLAAASDATITLDATTDYFSVVTSVEKTGTISAVHIRVGSATMIGTLSCQVQTLDSAGDPSGTAYGSCTQANVGVTSSNANSLVSFTGLACSAVAGDKVAIKIWPSALTSGTLNVVFNSHVSAGGITIRSFPYGTNRTTGTGAGSKTSIAYGATIEYSDGSIPHNALMPALTASATIIDSDSSVRRAGNAFTLPADMRVVGIWAYLDNDADTTTLKLYDTDGTTVLGSCTLTSAHRSNAGAGLNEYLFDGGTEVLLRANTSGYYRVVADTNNISATNCAVRLANNMVASHLGQLPMGTAWISTTHNGTAWADADTRRYYIGLHVSGIDSGTGSGRASFNLGF